MAGKDSLTVRHSERHDVAWEGEVWISMDHASRVRFNPAAGARDGRIKVTVTDVSEGGLGLMSPIFLPRMCHLELLVPDPSGEGLAPLIRARLRLQRVQMVERTPTYLLGASFLDDGPRISERGTALLEKLERDRAASGGSTAESRAEASPDA